MNFELLPRGKLGFKAHEELYFYGEILHIAGCEEMKFLHIAGCEENEISFHFAFLDAQDIICFI